MMMKKYTLLALFFILNLTWAQENNDAQIQVKKQRKELLQKIESHPFKKELDNPKRLPNGKLPPDLYFKEDYLRTMNPETGEVNPFQLNEIRKEIVNGRYTDEDATFSLYRMPGDTQDPWMERGPFSTGGRTRAVMFDPNDTTGKRVFAGGVSGGLWVNDDITQYNSQWQPIDAFWANTSISCITYDPNNPQVFYVGTGEVYVNGIRGLGIFKTTDGGETWTHIFDDTFGYTENGRLRGNYYITDIKVRDNNGQSELFVGVAGRLDDVFIGNYESGLYKSTDGGTTFTRVQDLYYGESQTTGLDVYYNINRIEIGADNSVWVGTINDPFSGTGIGGKIFRSMDGTNFTKIYEQTSGNVESGRIEVGLSSQNPDVAYALVRTYSSSSPVKIVKTTDGGTNWEEMPLPDDADNGIPANDFTRGQSFYDLVIAVDPVNDQNVYVGGIDLFKSTDGATTWEQISKWSNNNNLASLNVAFVHADQHAIKFNPQFPNQMLFGCDGGVYYVPDNSSFVGSSSVLRRNYGYNVTQFYSAKLNPTSSTSNEEILGGTQDNGSIVLSGVPNPQGFLNQFTYTGGDGGLVEFDDQGEYVINGYVYAYHYLTNLNTNNLFYLYPESERNYGSFINEIELDANLDVAYTYRSGGNYNVVSNLLGANSTADLDFFRTNVVTSGSITKLTVSPFNTASSTLYVGTNNGEIFRVTDAHLPTSTNVELNAPIVGSISEIAFGLSENEILATVSNYNVNNIWYSPDGGNTWEQKDGNLPDMPVRTIFMNPNTNNEVMIGTDLGVWTTSNFQDDNPTWVTSNNGLSNVKVLEFDYRESDRTVLAATYGRGIFTTEDSFMATIDVESQLSDFVVYPQPSKGELHVMFDNAENIDIKIYNTAGKLVFEKMDVSSQEAFTANLPSGVYILEATAKNGFKKSVNLMMK